MPVSIELYKNLRLMYENALYDIERLERHIEEEELPKLSEISCVWEKVDDDGFSTECEAYQLEENINKDWKYCPYCGKLIVWME